MAHFFVSPKEFYDGYVTIKEADAWHIRKVLRLKVGNTITVSNGAGKVYRAVISKIDKEKVVCHITGKVNVPEPDIDVVLVPSISKNNKMDFVIQKSVELGVKRIIPLRCTRVVVKLNAERKKKRLDRWQRIAREAAKQCRRASIPGVSEPVGWDTLFGMIDNDALVLIPWEESRVSLKDTLNSNFPEKVYVIIGPEGGFTRSEVVSAESKGACSVSLGPRILRTETAGIATLAMVLYHYDCLGVLP